MTYVQGRFAAEPGPSGKQPESGLGLFDRFSRGGTPWARLGSVSDQSLTTLANAIPLGQSQWPFRSLAPARLCFGRRLAHTPVRRLRPFRT